MFFFGYVAVSLLFLKKDKGKKKKKKIKVAEKKTAEIGDKKAMWSVNMMTYNLMLPVSEPLRFNGQEQRSSRIPAELAKLDATMLGGLDIVAFQELIPPGYRHKVLLAMRQIGFPFQTPVLSVPFTTNQFKLASGGVVICSRHPIIATSNHVFDTICEGADCMACKGVVYARILLPNSNVINVFVTHLQAWDTPKASDIRRAQCQQVVTFMKTCNIVADEVVVLMGDLNVDYFSNQAELLRMLETMHMTLVPHVTPAGIHAVFSSDPATNVLVGNDETLMYATQEYPKGCYDEYINALSCPCCPRERLDYALVSADHLKPVSGTSYIYPLKTAEPFNVQLNVTTTRAIRDLSDHYPLLTRLTFANKTPFKHRQVLATANKRYHQAVVIIGISACMVYVVLWLLIRRRTVRTH